ncbi:MAG: Hsp20/alpha crystallin family protein [Chloroflexi bacterium]|nr:Hsp20/alpha crystallin family protein [Chloroflexota bacterium]
MAMEVWRPRSMSPFRLLDEMEHEMEDLMGRQTAWPFRTLWRRAPGDGMAFAPDVEVVDKGDRLIVCMDLPGIKKEEIDISMTGNTLTVKGERKKATEVKEEEYQRTEIRYGSFLRSVTLDEDVNAEKIEANLKDGVLEVVLPKVEAAKPTRIQIKAK